MHMAAHHDAREFDDRGFSEHNAPGQNLQVSQLANERHAVPSDQRPHQAGPPLSPTTPPTRAQEVRVRCEATDCQALLQVAIPLSQPVRQAVIVKCGGCQRLLEVQLAGALEHLEQQRQNPRGFPPQPSATTHPYPSYQPQYSQPQQQTYQIPPPVQPLHNASPEQLMTPALQSQPYAPIPPPYQPPHSQASTAGYAFGPSSTTVQHPVQGLTEMPWTVCSSPVHHHVARVPLPAQPPGQPLAPPAGLQTPQVPSEPSQPARHDAYSRYDQHGNHYSDYRPAPQVPNPFSVNTPHPHAPAPPPAYVTHHPPSHPYSHTPTQNETQYLHPARNPSAYSSGSYPEAPVYSTPASRPYPPHSHSSYPHPQHHEPPSPQFAPSQQATYLQHPHPDQQYQYQQQQAQHQHYGHQMAQTHQQHGTHPHHSAWPPGLDVGNDSSSSMGQEAEGGSGRKKRKDRPIKEPTPYNVFVREEIARLKEANPDIIHKLAFARAAASWQHAPNNNGRAKKLRLKKEAEAAAEAAAQPEALTPPASQEPPAQSVCVPLHADRHLLQWPQAVAPRQPTELIDHSQAASNVNASEQTAEVMNPTNAASRQTAEHSDYAQAAVNTEPSHEVAQQAVTIAEQTTDQVAQQPLQPGPSKPSGHEDAVQQARTETATPATAAANQAMQSQCPEGTEHRKVLGHRFAGLSKPSFILPDADDPQNRSQQFPAVPAAHTASPESCARPLTYISGAHAVQPEPPPHHSPVGHQSAAHSSPYPFVVNGAHSHSTATHTTGTTPMELVMERFPGPARGPSPEPAVAQDRRLAEPFPERSSAEPKPCAPVNAFSQWVAVQDPATAAKQAEADPELLHAKPSMEQRLEGGASAAGPLPQPATDFRLDTGGTVNTCNPIH